MKINRLRIKIMTLAMFVFSLAILFSAFAASDSGYTKSYSWGLSFGKDGLPPEPGEKCDFFQKYNTLYIGDTSEKVIYITFDAGFENGNTGKILDALKKHNAPAAFFVVEHYIRANPELSKRIIDEGHLLCNHSVKHKDMTQISDFEKFKKEITGLEDACTEVTGKPLAKFFRPPEGKYSQRCLDYVNQLSYRTVLWSFAYHDWDNDAQPSRESAMKKVLSRTHNGAIVLLHSTSSTNANILDDLLTEWEKYGYRFASLEDL